MKESMQDSPLTVSESLSLLRDTGFINEEIIWLHDTFGVFYATKPKEEEEEEDKKLMELVALLADIPNQLHGLNEETKKELGRTIMSPSFYAQKGLDDK